MSGLVVTSMLGLVVTQPTRTLGTERMFAESLPRYRDRQLYLSPRLASFLIVYSGEPRPEGVTIHLLEEGAHSDTWHSLHALWPEAPVVDNSAAITRGYVAFSRVLDPERIPARWRRVAVLAAPVPASTWYVVNLLRVIGVPQHLLRRLLPGQGRAVDLYAVD